MELSAEFFKLKNYFLKLVTDPNPTLQLTKEFVRQHNYIFNAYLEGNNIIRHYFVTKQNVGSSVKSVSILPTKMKDFNQLQLYQSDIFNEFDNNLCLRKLLQAKNPRTLINNNVCEKDDQVTAFNDDIVITNHIANNETIKIVAVRGAAFIEIYCKDSSKIFTADKIIIIAMSEQCSTLVNKLQILTGNRQWSSFEAKILFQLSINKDNLTFLQQDWFIALIALAVIALGGSLMTCIFLAKCKAKMIAIPTDKTQEMDHTPIKKLTTR